MEGPGCRGCVFCSVLFQAALLVSWKLWGLVLVRFCIFRTAVGGGFIGMDEWGRMECDIVLLFCFVIRGDQWQLWNRRIGRRFCCRNWAL